MRKLMVGPFSHSMPPILVAAMMGGMDGGTMLDLVPSYRALEGDERLAEAERLTTELLGPAPERPWLPKSEVKQCGSQADPEAVRKKAVARAALANRKTRDRKKKRK